jgi:hypothetical protein
MSPRTMFLSRLIGLYALLGTLSMVVHGQATVDMVTTLMHNPPVLFLAAVITLVAGLAIVLSHNVWTGGALPVIITLTGWIVLIKGLVFLCLSPEAAQAYFAALHYEQYIYLYSGVSLILGAYLTYAGFRPVSR